MDRHDGVAGLDQGIDQQARRALDRDGQFGRRRQTRQTGAHGFDALGRVQRLQRLDHAAASVIDDTDGMRAAAPVRPTK
jgi:hypothetical protein